MALCCAYAAAESTGDDATRSKTVTLDETATLDDAGALGSAPVLGSFKTLNNIAFVQPNNNTLYRPTPTPKAKVVLILDDLGNNLTLGERAIKLPGNINYSFLPQSPNGSLLARHAHQQGKEVMLHIPMSNIHGRRMGPGALTPIMEKEQFINTLREDLLSIPHIQGVNNHMGSLLTQLHQPMSWFMQELKQQRLYFIDSRTSPLTVAESLAKSYKLPHLRRNVFLDNQRNKQAISVQFEQLITLAKQKGSAVAIGHPHPETLEFLEQTLPGLDQRGVRLVFASEMFNNEANDCNIAIVNGTGTDGGCSKLSHLTE